MSEVHVKEGESLDSALKRFKRSCAKAGVLAEVRKRECYESPSVKRRKKSEAARKNRNKRYYEDHSKKEAYSCDASFFELGFSACRSPLRALQGVAADAQVVLRDDFVWVRAVRREMTQVACYPARGVLYSCQREWIR